MKEGRREPKPGRPPRPPRPPPPSYPALTAYPTAAPAGDYVLLPPNPRPSRLRCYLTSAAYALLPIFVVATAFFLLWPSDPELSVVRLRLDRVAVSSPNPLSIDVSMDLTVRVRNRDFFSLDYRSLVVSIGYRDRQLGFVTSDGGRIRARASSYVNAVLSLDGVEVLHDIFYLLEDLARGSVPFDTVSDVKGHLHFFFFQIPLQAKISCEVVVNTKNQTVIRQDCYPE